MPKQPIKAALGRGERLKLGGAYVECVPASLADLEDAMMYWSQSLGRVGLQMCYHPKHKEIAKPAFEELLYMATGRKIPKEELLQKINVANGGQEVVDFIDRFLGFITDGTGESESVE